MNLKEFCLIVFLTLQNKVAYFRQSISILSIPTSHISTYTSFGSIFILNTNESYFHTSQFLIYVLNSCSNHLIITKIILCMKYFGLFYTHYFWWGERASCMTPDDKGCFIMTILSTCLNLELRHMFKVEWKFNRDSDQGMMACSWWIWYESHSSYFFI